MTREWEQHMNEMESAAEAHHNGMCVEAILHDWEVKSLLELNNLLHRTFPSNPWVQVRLTDHRVLNASDNALADIDWGEISGILVGALVPDVLDEHGLPRQVIADWLYFEHCETREIAVEDFAITVDWVEEETRELWAEYAWESRLPKDVGAA